MMNRRVFLAGAMALPFLAIVKVPVSRARRVQVTIPLIFQEGDARFHRSVIGMKMQKAVADVMAANPRLSPDLARRVSFDMRRSDGTPWGRPGALTLPAKAVFKGKEPWTAPRHVVMAKSLCRGLECEPAPNIGDLSRIVVKAVFHVAPV